jgi:penicillin-binding protein 1C
MLLITKHIISLLLNLRNSIRHTIDKRGRSFRRLGPLKKITAFIFIISLAYWWFFALPAELFHTPTSTVLYGQQENLLGATIAADGQWRFPLQKDIPVKFSEALISFEDERFYYHPGFDIFSIARAMFQNIKERKIVSGASTLSMQVIRLHRVDKPRNWSEKIIEMLLAVRLECRYSKAEILALWSAHAPFGGNVVGLEAAAWRYYGRSPESLSWAEAVTLAVLPNAPAIIHPGKNRDVLLKKRNRILQKLVADGVIDETTADLASMEDLPERPKPMPQIAPHLLARARVEGHAGTRIKSTLDQALQIEATKIVHRHYDQLKQNEIHNAAVLILDVKTNEVVAYVGNTKAGKTHGEDVDIIHAPRSSGSILKPLLYAAMNQAGKLLPTQLVPDVPTQIGGYRPKNFHDHYDGAVPADEALSRSLNIPAVRMLQDYGVEKFHSQLQQMKFSTITHSADHYGLSLILGGAEVTLWDLARTYRSMAEVLNQYHVRHGIYESNDWAEMTYIRQATTTHAPQGNSTPVLDAGSTYLTMEALRSVKRPTSELGWKQFAASRHVAWKTGTSIGFRDAWAVGITPEYLVAVWVGNADGEGRPGLVGVHAAAPILFDLYHALPATTWFEPPHDELREANICVVSGHLADGACRKVAVQLIHKNGRRSATCPYHQRIFTDTAGQYQVNASCYPRQDMVERSLFVLPPAMAYHYRQQHGDYDQALPLHPQCRPQKNHTDIEIVYPEYQARIKVPTDLAGDQGNTIFEVAHADPSATVFWHIDDQFMGKTESRHALALHPAPGVHTLKVVDMMGNERMRRFEVLD